MARTSQSYIGAFEPSASASKTQPAQSMIIQLAFSEDDSLACPRPSRTESVIALCRARVLRTYGPWISEKRWGKMMVTVKYDVRARKVLTQLLRPLTYRASLRLLPSPAPPLQLFLHHIGLSVDMSTTVVACQSNECLNGHPPSKMECPTCNKYVIYPVQCRLFVLILLRLGIKGSLFCSQECFKAACEH